MQIEEKEYDQSFDWRIWKKLFPFMKPFRKYMIIALVFNTLCALVDIALPLFQQYAINHFISGNTTEGIGSFAGTYLVTIIFQTVSVVIFCRCAMVIEMNMAKNIVISLIMICFMTGYLLKLTISMHVRGSLRIKKRMSISV